MEGFSIDQITIWVSFTYAMILAILFFGYLLALRKNHQQEPSGPQCSILIPFRNEAENLQNLMNDLAVQDFSGKLDQVICVNDHSEDKSVSSLLAYANQLPISIIELSGNEMGKKAALSKGWSEMKSTFCIQLDADVRLGSQWFRDLSNELNDSTDVLVLPVIFKANSLFQKLICLEFMSVHAMTFSMLAYNTPIMANGAHLVYKRALIKEIDRSEEWNRTVSGDDMAILHSALANSASIRYSLNRNLVASTNAPLSLIDFIRQRTRWISKVGKQYSVFSILPALIFVLVNALLIVLGLSCIFNSSFLESFKILFLVKFGFDLIFILPSLIHFRKLNWIILYPVLAILYPFYVLLILANSLSRNSRWKGRRIKVR